jgi:hypothetical protein
MSYQFFVYDASGNKFQATWDGSAVKVGEKAQNTARDSTLVKDWLAEINILQKGNLTEFEKGLLTSVTKQQTMSVKQHAVFLKIVDKYLKYDKQDLKPTQPVDNDIPFEHEEVAF